MMKRLLIVCALLACEASPPPTPDAPPSPPAPAAPAPPAQPTAPMVYEYTYPYNTSLNENSFIVLDSLGGAVRGWFYGTTDEFDTAREGYVPGFFVAEMQDLAIRNDSISFSLAQPERFFTSPVTTLFRSSKDVSANNKPWATVRLETSRKNYTGTYSADRIVLIDPFGRREFKKRP